MKIKQQYLIRLILMAFLAQQGICLGQQAKLDPEPTEGSDNETQSRLMHDPSVAATDPTSAPATTTTDSNAGGSGTAREPYIPLPTHMQNRCGEARIKRMLEAGGTPQTEIAIQKGIDWLKSKQKPDGSWGNAYANADTGFALLVLTGSCEIAEDSIAEEQFNKAVVFLINQYKKNGHLCTAPTMSSPGTYEHAVATYALAEAYIFCKSFSMEIPELENTLRLAGNQVMGGQNPKGGWDYSYGQGSEGRTSVALWQIQALYACQQTGIWPKERFQPIYDKFMKWIVTRQSKQVENVGAVGYQTDPTKSPKLTCGTYLAFQMGSRGKSKPAQLMLEFIKSAGYTTEKYAKVSGPDYYQYYLFQAMRNAGGEDWDKYHHILRDSLLASQFEDGKWVGQSQYAQGAHLGTCLALLSLQTYYRNLPPKQVGH